jgi:hypothetical protein
MSHICNCYAKYGHEVRLHHKAIRETAGEIFISENASRTRQTITICIVSTAETNVCKWQISHCLLWPCWDAKQQASSIDYTRVPTSRETCKLSVQEPPLFSRNLRLWLIQLYHEFKLHLYLCSKIWRKRFAYGLICWCLRCGQIHCSPYHHNFFHYFEIILPNVASVCLAFLHISEISIFIHGPDASYPYPSFRAFLQLLQGMPFLIGHYSFIPNSAFAANLPPP